MENESNEFQFVSSKSIFIKLFDLWLKTVYNSSRKWETTENVVATYLKLTTHSPGQKAECVVIFISYLLKSLR